MLKRSLSSASFAELFRKSVDNVPLTSGDVVEGRVVGTVHPRSTSSRFYLIDFGLKTEAPFTPQEVPTVSTAGDSVAMPLLQIEDDFNEPVTDPDGRSQMPAIQAERYSLLLRSSPSNVRLVHGRFTRFNRGGATAKVLGIDAFVPRHHVLAFKRPVLGTFSPFYVLSMNAERVTPNTSNSNLTKAIEIHPVISSYGGALFCLANLVGRDEAWERSGGGSAVERFAYLRLLTKILQQKNPAVRRLLPRSHTAPTTTGTKRPVWRKARRAEESDGDTAWLRELPRGTWISSDQQGSSQTVLKRPPPTYSGARPDWSKGRNNNRGN